MSHKTWIAKRSLSIDLEYDTAFEVREGMTYTDDGTTVFGDYVCDELFAPATPGPGTIVVTHPEARRSRRN
ncbi:hypothetical protein [Rhodopseudomonas sp. P2A-2r]|uniref:hypothetical protein n=1 Tax=unclassified Rhodopseudomonas TaxID=2638247 RepID=UPI002234DA96|nr:hypothetical protein [Rhodopseudomonas sp. P2A-2r]UZE48179.1 hypothetical protein ONR75_25630 [Rhodopseudomonas sp. P2A-2r]